MQPHMADDDDDYKVGPGRPPLHTRFLKGQSGNPGGRSHKKLHALLAACSASPPSAPISAGPTNTPTPRSTGSRGPKASAAEISPPGAEFARRREDTARIGLLGRTAAEIASLSS
jgi:hypothetical protein